MDMWSRYITVLLVNNKSQTMLADKLVGTLKDWSLTHGTPIRSLRTDAGSEFVNNTVQSYLLSVGAKPKPAPSQDQATNGAAESRIRVIKDMARCYMIQAHLGIEFFCYAVLYAVAIMNIAKNSVTKDIPFRRWFRAEPVIKDMAIHPLGCLATVWEEKKSRNQLGQKSYPGIYLGPTGTSLKLYLIFSAETQKITVERHVEIFPGMFPGLKKINGKLDILDLRKIETYLRR